MAEFVPKNAFTVVYEGQNITDDISRYLSKLRYKDSTKGKADELEIILDDSAGKWRNEWYPSKRDSINASISSGGPFLQCGDFEIDEIEFDLSPDTITIRALATGVTKKLRTKHHKSHESKSLKQIAQAICTDHGFTLDTGTSVVTKKKEVESNIQAIEVIKSDLFEAKALEATPEIIPALQKIGPKVGSVARDLEKKDFKVQADIVTSGWRFLASTNYTAPAIDYYLKRLDLVTSQLTPYLQKTEKMVVANDLSSITVERSTQNGETDLAYLSRVSAEFGFYFNIKGNTMIFYQVYNLEGRSASITLSRSQLSKCNIKDSSVGTAKAATVTSHNPQSNEVITATVNQEESFPSGDPAEITAEDTIEVKKKAETQQQAEAMAKAELHTANKKTVSGTFTAPLDINLVSGNNVKLVDVGELSGVYHIEEAEFEIDAAGGGNVTCEVYRVAKVEKSDKKL